jgi:hypothetical protein
MQKPRPRRPRLLALIASMASGSGADALASTEARGPDASTGRMGRNRRCHVQEWHGTGLPIRSLQPRAGASSAPARTTECRPVRARTESRLRRPALRDGNASVGRPARDCAVFAGSGDESQRERGGDLVGTAESRRTMCRAQPLPPAPAQHRLCAHARSARHHSRSRAAFSRPCSVSSRSLSAACSRACSACLLAYLRCRLYWK